MSPARLSDRLHLLQYLLPLGIGLAAALYQLGPARYVDAYVSHDGHWAMEVLLYGLLGPLVIWLALRLIHGWIVDKERAEAEVYRLNAELQQRVDERTRELSAKNQALAAANQQLQELDGLKSEFVSLVSHELRAPLTNMRGALELMEGGCPTLDATCGRMFVVVNGQVQRLERLVENVLNISRIEAGGLVLERAAVDVIWLSERAIDEFAMRHAARRFLRPRTRDHLRVWADPDCLYQVIANLVDNALKYSPPGSEVALSVEIQAEDGVVSVSDHGRGIPLAEQGRIFDKFYRLDTGDSKETYGSGLGLYFCHRVIEAMHGRIWVESVPGQGATFRFALPLVKA